MPSTPGHALLRTMLALTLVFSATELSAAKKKESKVKARDYSRVQAVLQTTQGDITVRFFFDKAPAHVKSFVDLSDKGFYDGTLFHRVIPGFMIQGGDPLTKDMVKAAVWGTGVNTDAKGNPINIPAEFNDTTHKRGILSMARATDPNSASAQFFIVVQDYPSLDHQYTAFGEVVGGLDVLDKIVASSNPDTNDPRTGGKPRNYQKLQKVNVTEEAPPGA